MVILHNYFFFTGRSYQASRVRADRDRDDRPPPSRSTDDGWTTVRGR